MSSRFSDQPGASRNRAGVNLSSFPPHFVLSATVAPPAPLPCPGLLACPALCDHGQVAHDLLCLQVMKTYHMYHAESISAESKLKEAEKQEEKQFNKSGDISVNLLRHEDRPQRRSSVKKIEKMKEKVGEREGGGSWAGAGAPCRQPSALSLPVRPFLCLWEGVRKAGVSCACSVGGQH